MFLIPKAMWTGRGRPYFSGDTGWGAGMAEIAASDGGVRASRAADWALKGAVGLWFLAALAGQWLFFYYIALFYGPSTLSGNFQGWTRNHALIKGYVAGDNAGNLAFGVHALLAGYMAFGGVLQLVPRIRTAFPKFHRWNGRVFLVTGFALSLTGLYMVWVRGAVANLTGAVAISLNAALIMLFAGLAWSRALARDFTSHRAWALRTFLVANGQWFFRVGVFGWIILAQGPVGFGKNFDGPFVVGWSFGCYLLPLAVLELYLRAKARQRGRFAMAGALALFAALTALGIFGVYMFMWKPVLARL